MKTRPTPQDHDILDDHDLARLREILSDAEHSARLTDWEANFCDDIRDRVLEYAERTRISAKQWEVIERIEGKLYG